MFRIDSEGATAGNLFTEGDPGLAIPATVVSDEWLNEVQEELTTVVESMGFALVKASQNQVWASLLELALRGGLASPIIQALSNNAGPLDVAGMEFDSATTHAKEASYFIERKTDTQNVQEQGKIFIRWNSADSNWDISFSSNFDDGGVIFSAVLESGTNFKLQYTTTDLTGTTYSGTLVLTSIIEIRNS